MNSSQVRSKARTAMARREEEIEEEEIMSGEINLVPYLDIVTNLMLFLLASITSGFILGQINTTLPDHTASTSKPAVDPEKKPEEQLQLMVSVTKNRLLLWSISGLEGTLNEPKLTLGLLPPEKASDPPSFDYEKLNLALIEIAKRRWGGQMRPLSTYEILLQADGDIPYETVIAVMDNMRHPLHSKEKPTLKEGEELIFALPKVKTKTVTENGKEVEVPVLDEDGNQIPVEAYDHTKHFLFDNVLFAKPSFD